MPPASSGPGYLTLLRSGALLRLEEELWAGLGACRLCPRACGVDRLRGELGVCQSGPPCRVASAGPHFGEERPLVGRGGSGTLFLAGCSLRCAFCQNAEIAHLGAGAELDCAQVARRMLALQDAGCENINWVTPTHVAPALVRALRLAAEQGLRLPLVWNSGGYDGLELVRKLAGVVDIYLPDLKFQDGAVAERLCQGAADYPAAAAEAVREMHRQVGPLRLDARGVARRGLLVRHLVLPHNLAGTDRLVRFIAAELSADTYLNLMDQYRPCFRAGEHAELERAASQAEIAQARAWALAAGLTRLDSG